MKRLLIVLALLIAPVHAHAAPVVAAYAVIAAKIAVVATAAAQAIGISYAVASAIAAAWNAAVISFVIGKISKVLVGSPKAANTVTSQTYTLRSAKAPCEILYGLVRKSGVVIFEGTSGSSRQYLWRVVAIAGHQCEAMTDVWLGPDLIADANIDAGTGAVTGGSYAGKLYIWRLLGGSAQTALSELNAAFTEITANHKGQGIAMLVTRRERDDAVFPSGGAVDEFVLVKGKRVYDPRLDSTNGGSGAHRYTDATTWAWSANSALCAADYVTGGSAVFDTATPINRLGMRVPPARINWPLLLSSANKCAETPEIPGGTQARYTCNAVLSCADSHEASLDTILGSMHGNRVFTAGKYNIYAGAYDTPSESITDSDLKDGGYKIQGALSGNEVFNQVSGVYFDASRGWQETTSYVRRDAAFETADKQPNLRTIALPAVTNEYQAQRIAEIAKQQSRNQITVELNLKLSALRVAPWDTFYLTLSDLGWADRVFRAMSIEMNLSERLVKVSAKEESATAYADLDDTEYSVAGSASATREVESPAPPSNLAATGQVDGVLLQWDRSATPGVTYEVSMSSSSSMSSPTTVYDGADSQAVVARTSTTGVYFSVRAKRLGVYSASVPGTGGVYAEALSVSAGYRLTASPGSVSRSTPNASVTTSAVVVTPMGGTPSYTHSWTRISGDASTTISSTSASNPTFTRSSMTLNSTYSSVWRDTVTDGAAAVETIDVPVNITREN